MNSENIASVLVIINIIKRSLPAKQADLLSKKLFILNGKVSLLVKVQK